MSEVADITLLTETTSTSSPLEGAVKKVRLLPEKLYVDLFWYTPLIYTIVSFFDSGEPLTNVNDVWLPVPEKKSESTSENVIEVACKFFLDSTSIESPLEGAVVKLNVAPITEYVDFYWYTPLIYTSVCVSFVGANESVKSVVVQLPVNVLFCICPTSATLSAEVIYIISTL